MKRKGYIREKGAKLLKIHENHMLILDVKSNFCFGSPPESSFFSSKLFPRELQIVDYIQLKIYNL